MIVVIGEALIDLIESKQQSGSYQAVVGGANANVAIALARAGTPQQLLARISSSIDFLFLFKESKVVAIS